MPALDRESLFRHLVDRGVPEEEANKTADWMYDFWHPSYQQVKPSTENAAPELTNGSEANTSEATQSDLSQE